MIQISQTLTFFGLICFLFINGIISTADENLSHDPICIKPINYTMNITAEVQKNSLTVNSYIKLNVSCVLQVMRINFGRYCKVVHKFYIDNGIFSDSTYSKWLYKSFFTEKQSFIDIINQYQKSSKNENIQPGIYSIHARYNCILDKVATIFSYINIKHQTIKEQYLILPRIPAEWIVPYWVNSTTKAEFTIQFIHDSAEMALSHMPSDRNILDNDKVSTSFPTTPVMFTHLLATAVIPYEYAVPIFSSNTIIIQSRLQVKNDISYALFLIRNITKFIKHEIKDVIPTSYVHYVALPINSSSYETIVTTGLVLFRETDVVYDKKIDSIIKKQQVTCLVARSVIQEIFSNWLVRFKQSDPWFIEGFSTFYGVYLFDQIYNETLLKSIMVQTRQIVFEYIQACIEYDDLPIALSLQNVIFNKMWKEKAFNIFYMINSFFYDKVVLYNVIFKEAINLYNTTSNDTYNNQSIFYTLWNNVMFVPSIHENTKLSNIHNTNNMITSWITQDGYPIIQVKRNNDTQSLEIMVQDCFTFKQTGLCEYKWWIPISFIKISESITRFHFYLKPDGIKELITSIKKDDFIMITTHNGYRVNYDYKSWENIAFFLKNPNPMIWDAYEFSNVSLAHILNDAFYFLIQNTKYNEHSAEKNNIDIFFNLASNIVNLEKSYISLNPIFTALQYMSQVFPFSENTKIKNKVLGILNCFLEKTSHKNISENSIENQIYYEVIKWTCILDQHALTCPKCKEHVNATLRYHLKNPVQHRLLPSWQRWIYCEGLMLKIISNDMLWHKIQDIYMSQKKKEQFFQLFSCSGLNHSLESLRFVLKNNLVKESDAVTILFDIVARHVDDVSFSLNIIIRETQDTFPSMYVPSERYMSLLAVMCFTINHIYSDESLEKITDTKVLFVQLLNFVHGLNDTARFMLNVIINKAQSRRKFISRMRHYNNLDKIHDLLDFTNMKN